jgi:hypothetical protein
MRGPLDKFLITKHPDQGLGGASWAASRGLIGAFPAPRPSDQLTISRTAIMPASSWLRMWQCRTVLPV